MTTSIELLRLVKSLPRQPCDHRPPFCGRGDEEKPPGVSQVLLFSFRTGKGLQNQKKTAESLRETEGRIRGIWYDFPSQLPKYKMFFKAIFIGRENICIKWENDDNPNSGEARYVAAAQTLGKLWNLSWWEAPGPACVKYLGVIVTYFQEHFSSWNKYSLNFKEV